MNLIDNPRIGLLIVIFVSLCIMVLGFFDALVQYGPVLLPGPSFSIQSGLLPISTAPISTSVMSLGILLFTFIPGLRVIFGLETFIRRGEIVNEMAALVVIAELVISIFI